MTKYFIIFLSTLPVASVVFAQQQMSASGQVVSARTLTRTMTVRDAAANEVIRYNLPRDTNVTLAGQPGRLGYLRNGDQVDINYVNTDEGRRAIRVRVPQPTPGLDQRVTEGEYSTITGRVERADFRNRTITVLGDQSGERFTYAVPEQTRVTIGGQDARFGHLDRGDRVTLRFREEGGQRQAARVRVPEPVTPLAQRRNQAPPAGVSAQQQTPRTQLPRTASALPLLGFLGVLALGGAAAMRLTRFVRRN